MTTSPGRMEHDPIGIQIPNNGHRECNQSVALEETVDGQSELIITPTSSQGSTPTSSFDNGHGNVISRTPDKLKELILHKNECITVPLAPILLLINGLPQSGKSEAILSLLNGLPEFQKIQRETPKHGLSFFEIAAIEVPEPNGPDKILKYVQTTPDDCYLYAIKSAIKEREKVFDESASIEYNEFFNNQFESQVLNDHLLNTFQQLKRMKRKTLGKDWETCISSGISIINIWDVGLSRTIYHFLPALTGLLYNSYSWLFFDLQRDPNNFDKLPTSNEMNLMKWRSRIHYLLRRAKLNDSSEFKRVNVCSLFAKHDTTFGPRNADSLVNQELRTKLANTAAKLGVQDLVDTHNITVVPFKTNEKGNTCTCTSTRELRQAASKLIFKALADKIQVPLSFIFLRSFYYKNDKILYVKREEIKKIAEELGISDEEFTTFCKLFTSSGSIIDLTLIDENSQYIILKPNLFLQQLNEIFNTNDDLSTTFGLLTLFTAESIFKGRENAQVFTKILTSLNLAVEIRQNQIECDNLPSLQSSNKIWYLPDMRNTKPLTDTTEPTKNTLRMIRDLNAPQGHLQTSFVRKFLLINPQSKLCARNYANNVTTIQALDEENQIFVEFEVVYFGYTLEFRVSKVNRLIFKQIIQTCHNVMNEKKHETTNYNFAVMCSRDPNTAVVYELTRERHLLPDSELCEDCRRNGRHQEEYLCMWNQVLQESGMSVPSNRELNGNAILLKDACFIAQKMQPPHLSQATIEYFYKMLELPDDTFSDIKANLQDWQLPMGMLIEWNKREKDNKNLKRTLAMKLVAVANEHEEDSESLKEIVRYLDSEVLRPLEPFDDRDHKKDDEEGPQFSLD